MRKPRVLKFGQIVLCLGAAELLMLPVQAAANKPTVTHSVRQDVSADLRDMAKAAPQSAGAQSQQAPVALPTGPALTNSRPDPVAQQSAGTLSNLATVLNFDGQNDNDTLNLLGVKYVPPDTNGAVGSSQFVQIVNVTLAVYDKKTGSIVLGPALISSVWNGFGGPCETGNGGDPVVLYDQLANRWFISQLQFGSTGNQECMAVSAGSDATGSYHRYEFDFGSDFPDYPKFAVWPDAYYSSQNMFTPKFTGARACALDRAAMLIGDPATMICFQTTTASLLPSNLDGSTLPAAGQPNVFASIADSSNLNIFKFHVDFAHPRNSILGGPTLIPVAPFSEICARASDTACIPEPTPGERVDGLGDRLMFRLAYRNFGDHESLVVNHTVKGGALAGVRWYEIRSPFSVPFVFQQGTVVDPDTNFWMGSIAMDGAGNIALGFSASSKALDPSVFVVGRAPADPPGTMTGPAVLVYGGGVQERSFKRWGDYSSMAIDPSDDCTFWYTQEYYKTTGSFNWSTRISAFKFDSCTAHGE